MATSFIATFDDPRGTDRLLVGGKGANLAALTGAGFDVPDGFCVTTDAYTAFLEQDEAGAKLGALVAELVYDPEALESQTERIRNLIRGGPCPRQLRTEVEQAYRRLGVEAFVAVRSSGTAEDLAEASFAGLHDTYLDIHGIDALLEAIQRCWASMWTSRATAYRHDNGIDHAEAKLAVVVQSMVSSDSSGVMFTGNPLTTATDEIVINACWGLGESVVSGITDPDTFLLRHGDLSIKEKVLGDKETSIRRADGDAGGTEQLATPPAQRVEYSLTDEQARRLAALGRRIQEHYEGFPQDVEWALLDGRFHVLQSRPITGVEFSWDADVESGHLLPDDDSTTWTRSFADDVSTGVVTPLHYSIRYGGFYSNENWPHAANGMGLSGAAKMRTFKYYKGEVYYNADFERIWVENATWRSFRPARLNWLPETWHQDVVNAEFSIAGYARMWARLQVADPGLRWNSMITELERWRTERRPQTRGLSDSDLRSLTDRELVRYAEQQVALEAEWGNYDTSGFLIYFVELLNILGAMLAKWYTGSNASAFVELVSGSDAPSDTQVENAKLSAFADKIRNSDELSALFSANQDGEFFAALGGSDAGRAFLDEYQAFLDEFGHRGQADRDLFYPRRSEDPSLDYRAIKVMLSGPPVDLDAREQEVNRRRVATYEEVRASIAASPFGGLKAELFGLVYRLLHRFIPSRDNKRGNPVDLLTMSQKNAYREIGRRMVERGQLEEDLDVLYLTRWELYPCFEGSERNPRLLKAKLGARKRDVLRFDAREITPPMYIRGYQPIDLSTGATEDSGLAGSGTSPGSVTGIARVVPRLGEIGRIEHGDILVTHATDPGWTPVFLIMNGVIVETGGLLSHAACLAREYGFPAVQLKNAVAVIPDGALIEINGTTGQVTILDAEPAAEAVPGTGER